MFVESTHLDLDLGFTIFRLLDCLFCSSFHLRFGAVQAQSWSWKQIPMISTKSTLILWQSTKQAMSSSFWLVKCDENQYDHQHQHKLIGCYQQVDLEAMYALQSHLSPAYCPTHVGAIEADGTFWYAPATGPTWTCRRTGLLLEGDLFLGDRVMVVPAHL